MVWRHGWKLGHRVNSAFLYWKSYKCVQGHTLNVRNMGSSNCKSFSPSKVAKASAVNSNAIDEEEYVEGIVCQENEIQDNEMKSFDLTDAGKVLIVKQKGVLSAIGAKCTHYGAPLAGGALGDGRVRCPWHGACFNISTGDIEDYPGLDSLPCYQVTIVDGGVKVRAKKSDLQQQKRVRTMVSHAPAEQQTYVIIGGGPSGATCVETLRQNNFQGKIIMVCKESNPPYDRIKVSKAMDFDVKKAALRSIDFYKKYGIEVLLNTEATAVNLSNKIVALNNGVSINYDKCYIATGSKPRVPDIPGASLKNVCVLRTYEDGLYVHNQLKSDKHVVVLGSSFIGLEAASYCVGKVAKVTIIGRDSVPLEAVFGLEIGTQIKKMFEEKGVELVMKSGIEKCIGENGVLTSVQLSDDTLLKADLCIFGVGSTLYTDFLQDSGIKMNSNGSIPVNSYMETNDSNVYAGGDIAYAGVYANDNQPAIIGHFPLAHYHGRIAALNMLGKKVPLKAVPFFWTVLFGKSIRYAGHGSYDEIKIEGNVSELKFVAFYFKGDRVVALASCQRDPVVSQYAELLSQGKSLMKSEVTVNPFAWTALISPSV